MRLFLSLAAAVSLAAAPQLGAQRPSTALPEQVTRYSREFAVSAAEFFGPTGLTGRYVASGCAEAYAQFGVFPCAELTVETGIEAATGLGAVRFMVSRLTSNADLAGATTGSDVSLSGCCSWEIQGTVFRSTLPGATQAAFVTGGVQLPEYVRRNTSLGDGNFGDRLYETFVPTAIPFGLALNYRFKVPPNQGAYCQSFPSEYCILEGATVRIASFTNVTAVPEPTTYALLSTGLLTLGGVGIRRRKRAIV